MQVIVAIAILHVLLGQLSQL